MIGGTQAYVSILFRFEGYPHAPPPLSESLGGLGLGKPLSPSREATKEVDSPHTKAPAPSLIRTVKSKPEPRIFFPRSPSLFSLSDSGIESFYCKGIFMTHIDKSIMGVNCIGTYKHALKQTEADRLP